MYDVIIIGAGVSGCAVARELARTEMKIAVLEKASDVCEGTSKANSGIVHAGYDAVPGTLKARLNLAGSRKMEALSKELDFSYKKNGSIVLCFDEKDIGKLEELKARGEANGVEELSILNREELLALEPNVGDDAVAALYAPTGGIVCPFGLTIALAENAAVNGVEFCFGEEVETIERKEQGYLIRTGNGGYETKVVVNAAGVYADKLHNMVSDSKMEIVPRKGEYLLYDKKVGNLVSHTLFQLPTALGKGILVTPTVHGNLLTGPTALDIPDKEGTQTSADGMKQVGAKAALSVKNIPGREVITSFAGLRAHVTVPPHAAGAVPVMEEDFVIGEAAGAPGFIDVAGMESPGLSCAPAVGEYVAEMVRAILKPREKKDFVSTRKGIPCMESASDEERQRLIKENPAYGNVICRCEMVTEGEILEAIRRPLGAKTTDGVKRRTRAGMGRCQSGFCNPKVVEILARELNVDEGAIRKAGGNSWYLLETAGSFLPSEDRG
ncbi:MAG: NAD(P)/FAD-dependent oxidoreductase [Lachnospiraceae bacterium]|jgi:glycerol-3-phosphate dehydrogenase|nr:NAD(P)/FAD-dependent oxidoreductase [Lachnospiraceae bacterium]